MIEITKEEELEIEISGVELFLTSSTNSGCFIPATERNRGNRSVRMSK